MQRRQLDFHDFDSVAAEIDRLQKNGYDKVGRWDLGVTCDHLSKVMQMSMEGFGFKGPWYFRLVIGPLIKGRFFRKRTMPEGFQAPKRVLPSEQVDEKAAVTGCKELLTRVRNHPGEFQ